MNSPSSPRVPPGHSEVCIVGDGAIAKTTALAFAQAGQSVTLLCPPLAPPAAAGHGWDVRVYALNHTAHTLLSSLRVWGALDAARVAPVDAMLVNGDGAHAGGLGFDAYGAHVGALAWIVEDGNLGQALDAALKFAQNVRVVHGRALRLERGDAHATVHLDGGDSIAAALVVGADGAQSWVRGQCDIGLDYRSYGQRGVVSNFACAKPHHGAAHQWFTGADGIVALLPLPGDRVSLVWSAPDALADTLRAESAAQLAARLAPLCADKLGALTPLQPELVRDFPLVLMRPHAMVAPRVALVGDAAHVVHPMAGHGMNLGFADVAELVKAVNAREPQRGIGDARVLARYARARKEDVLLMQLATDALARLFGSDIEPLRAVRNLGLNLLDKLPGLKRRLISHALGRPG
ncbi:MULTISPECIES: FAD-dependent monooxygenase [unclassified Janthinobacterium]|uniref:FAD-dependent monooxygenase n=1 Tax=unclassified Janthinobacterium TaxID=2610881 RepID=UPI000562C135|nr:MULTISPECIES: FAD-dependent monooxygenase [unclassified Janthinobacterium]MEC5159260.1 2-octaprenylphenol hydroxylase [Janthinobacterium sp. CG_S6]